MHYNEVKTVHSGSSSKNSHVTKWQIYDYYMKVLDLFHIVLFYDESFIIK
jgi:hypothetical protein